MRGLPLTPEGLKRELAKRGLPADGTKEELMARLLAANEHDRAAGRIPPGREPKPWTGPGVGPGGLQPFAPLDPARGGARPEDDEASSVSLSHLAQQKSVEVASLGSPQSPRHATRNPDSEPLTSIACLVPA